MSFRGVEVHEIREVLRLWLRGESPRAIERGFQTRGAELALARLLGGLADA
jgi:hypothetical protein